MAVVRYGEVSGTRKLVSAGSRRDNESDTDLSLMSSLTSEHHPVSTSSAHRGRASSLVSVL